MRNCPNCKTAVDDLNEFCGNCGSRVVSNADADAQRYASRVHCPQCGESHALDSSIVTIGKITRSYWVCRNCKKRFRDAEDLELELRKLPIPKVRLGSYFLSAILGAVIFIIGMVMNSAYHDMSNWEQAGSKGLQTVAVIAMLAGFVMLVMNLMLAVKFAQKWGQLLREKEELK